MFIFYLGQLYGSCLTCVFHIFQDFMDRLIIMDSDAKAHSLFNFEESHTFGLRYIYIKYKCIIKITVFSSNLSHILIGQIICNCDLVSMQYCEQNLIKCRLFTHISQSFLGTSEFLSLDQLATRVPCYVTCVHLIWFQSAECDDLLSGHLPVVAVSVQLPGHPAVSPGPQPQPQVGHYTSVNMNPHLK